MKEQRLSELLTPAIAALGLECLGLEYAPHARNSLLRVFIEAPNRPVTVDDCERVSREIAAVLDVEDPIQTRYTLEVSSPGLDRLLFNAAQVARHVGETAKFTMNLPQDGRRRMQGRIEAVDGDRIALDVEGEPMTLDFGNVAKARLVPDFSEILPGSRKKPGQKQVGPGKSGAAINRSGPKTIGRGNTSKARASDKAQATGPLTNSSPRGRVTALDKESNNRARVARAPQEP